MGWDLRAGGVPATQRGGARRSRQEGGRTHLEEVKGNRVPGGRALGGAGGDFGGLGKQVFW